jgi:hypothetical protein
MRSLKLKINNPVYFMALVIVIAIGGIILDKGKRDTRQKPENNSPATAPTYTDPLLQLVRPTLTNGSIIPGWRRYSDPSKEYSFEIPADWDVVMERDGNNKPLKVSRVIAKYKQNNKEYRFVFPQGGSEVNSDNTIKKQMVFAGINYEIRIFYKDETPFLISAIPLNERLARLYNHTELELPSISTDYYINIFYKILSTFKFAE